MTMLPCLCLGLLSLLVARGSGEEEIKIGYIAQKGGVEANVAAFELAVSDARADRIIDADQNVSLEQATGCEYRDAPRAANQLYQKKRVHAFFGPSCVSGMEVVGQFAAGAWDTPIIAIASMADSLSDRALYSTLVRVSGSITDYVKATLLILRHYNWNTIGLIRTSGVCESFSDVLQRESAEIQIGYVSPLIRLTRRVRVREGNVTYRRYKDMDLSYTLTDAVVHQLNSSARIVVVCLNNRSHDFMSLMRSYNMTGPEFAYVLVSLVQEPNRVPLKDDTEEIVAESYRQTIILGQQGQDSHLIDKYMTRLDMELTGHFQMTRDDFSPSLWSGYLLFHDSITLYLRAVSRCRQNDNCNWKSGVQLMDAMIQQSFQGVSGQVSMATTAERILSFFGKMATANLTLDPIFLIEAKDSEQTISILKDLNWKTADGKPPPAVPVCGFSNCPTDYTNIIVACTLVGVAMVLLAALTSYRIRKMQQEKALTGMKWRIEKGSLLISKAPTLSVRDMSQLSVRRPEDANHKIIDALTPTQITADIVVHSGEFCGMALHQNAQVAVKKCIVSEHFPLHTDRAALRLLKEMKDIAHDNLNSFVGICIDGPHVMTLVWGYCQKGSLEDILFADEISLDETFQASILRDILRGLDYLHKSPIKAHGRLSVSNCLVNSRWMVKLTDFGMPSVLHEYKRKEFTDNSRPLFWKSDNSQAFFQMAPEVRLSSLDMVIGTFEPTPLSDVFSYGMVIYQVLFRDIPVDFLELNSEAEPPKIDASKCKQYDAALLTLIEDCWKTVPSQRPSLQQIKVTLNSTLKGTSTNLVDHMVGMLERYAKNLENLVQSRTEQLEEERTRADNLLNKMLPPSVAARLKLGLTIDAEVFTSATLLNSDIVGFTRFCSRLKPMQIVGALNELYSLFDAAIEAHDAYKVETVGDAYLVASGLPIRNGRRHIVELADTALDLVQAIGEYSNAVGGKLQVRVGLHTGEVVAGVVGLAMPHYCLFGVNVQTTAMMEQTSESMKIQMSAAARNALVDTAPGMYEIIPNSTIKTPGGVVSETFWLQNRQNVPTIKEGVAF